MDPITAFLIAGLVLGGTALWRSQTPTTKKGTGAGTGLAGGVWPLPIMTIDGITYKPVVSQEYHAGHNGVDIMYRRRTATDRPEYPAGGHWGSKMHFIPGATVPVVAVADGKVWTSAMSTRGWNVVIDHGTHATYYQHMTAPKVAKGDIVKAGQQIGSVFYNSADDSEQLAHLHFEVWAGAASDHVNPQPFLDRWVHHA